MATKRQIIEEIKNLREDIKKESRFVWDEYVYTDPGNNYLEGKSEGLDSAMDMLDSLLDKLGESVR